MRQMNNWDKYRRKQININKSKVNQQVTDNLNRHYKYLYYKLVKSENDQDTFSDTFLKLTYNYDPDKDFINQFIYYFNLLKGAYYRDDKVSNYQTVFIEDDPAEASEIIDDDIEDLPVITEDNFFNNLIENINAIS